VEKGHEQSQRVGRFIKKHELTPDIVLSSPVLRAKETAKILAAEGCPKPIIEPWLACGMRPKTALEELKAYQQFNRVAMVGHEPDFSALVEHILGAETYSIRVKKASILAFPVNY
jgi:phosphohistidine phosphatase